MAVAVEHTTSFTLLVLKTPNKHEQGLDVGVYLLQLGRTKHTLRGGGEKELIANRQ